MAANATGKMNDAADLEGEQNFLPNVTARKEDRFHIRPKQRSPDFAMDAGRNPKPASTSKTGMGHPGNQIGSERLS